MKRFLPIFLLAPAVVAAQSDFDKSLTDIDNAGRSLVSAKCPKPLAKSEEQVKNRHVDDLTDEIRSVECTGYSLKYYVANATVPPRELPMRLTLTRPHKKLPAALNVGVVASQVRARLGPPESDKDGKITYIGVSEAGSDTITFVTKGDKITEILWVWDVD